MTEESPPRLVRDRHAPELATVDARHAVVPGQRRIDEGVVEWVGNCENMSEKKNNIKFGHLIILKSVNWGFLQNPQQKKNERTLNITIESYIKKPVLGQSKGLKKIQETVMKGKLDRGEITQEEFDKFKAEQNDSTKTKTVKEETFKFKFACIRTKV